MTSQHFVFQKTFYTPVHEAAAIIKARFADKVLMAKVREYLGGEILAQIPFILKQPVALSFRHVATPNFEHSLFIKLATQISMQPLFWEYFDDKFTNNNQVKYSLGKCQVYFGMGKHGGEKIERHSIIDFNKANGHPISQVKTTFHTSLVQFHHALFLRAYPEYKDSLFDASQVLHAWGDNAGEYYKKFMALFVCFGILFETFVPEDPSEAVFLDKVFIPAFHEVQEHFGLKPIIVSVLPDGEAMDEFWYFYSPENFSIPNKL